jgi:hypothetical protein
VRTGEEYLKTLNDGRTVLLDGQVVDDVLEHPAFARVARTMAELFDIAADPANGMQYHADKRILAENLYVSYATIPPQVSHATTASCRDRDGEGLAFNAGKFGSFKDFGHDELPWMF